VAEEIVVADRPRSSGRGLWLDSEPPGRPASRARKVPCGQSQQRAARAPEFGFLLRRRHSSYLSAATAAAA
jgi:hypothetical protein